MSQFYAPDARSAKTCRKSQLRRYTISVSGVDKSDGLVKSLHRDRSVSCGRRRRAAHPTMADHDDRRAVKQRDSPKTPVDYRGFQLRLEFRAASAPPVFHGCLVTWNSRKPPHTRVVRTHRVLRWLVIRLTAYLLLLCAAGTLAVGITSLCFARLMTESRNRVGYQRTPLNG